MMSLNVPANGTNGTGRDHKVLLRRPGWASLGKGAIGNRGNQKMEAETERIKKEIRQKSAPFCMKCGITRPYRILILPCTFTGSALLWWAFSLSTWVKIEIPEGSKVLFSALFAICSGEVSCVVPVPKSYCFIFGRIFMISALLLSFFLNLTLLAFPHSLPDTWKQYFVFTITCFIIGICVFLALLLHSLHVLKVTNVFKDVKITFLYPTFILSISIVLFFLSGILCFFSSHHCWFQCLLQRPIQVKPMQTPVVSGSPVTVSESISGGESWPNLQGE